MTLLIEFTVIFLLMAGVWLFRDPRKAKAGNMSAASALLFAMISILYVHRIVDIATVVIVLAIGATIGYAVAKAVDMTNIPAMVALQNGAGGAAACLVSLVELMRGGHTIDPVGMAAGVIGLSVGSLTFSGSMAAGAKLAGKIRQTPQILPAHSGLIRLNSALILIVGAAPFIFPAGSVFFYLALILLSAVFGVLFSIRIGGADMPVLISFLNAMTGLGAALCGMAIGNRMLIIFGAVVAASGSILTYLMCKAMNRSMAGVFTTYHKQSKPFGAAETEKAFAGQSDAGEADSPGSENAFEKAVDIIDDARNVVIIPGYGMALAKAQKEVSELGKKLVLLGKDVQYAVHPVAGRMPGHMNVLLAEAGVDYDMLVEMEAVNPDFPDTDLALIVGACDVVNPSAIETEGTPISGMPILTAHQAKHVICCNFDTRPGYSGVENPLYANENTTMLPGDAGETIRQLLKAVSGGESGTAVRDFNAEASESLACAKNVVIIPGYGMALSKAQFKVVELASILSDRGVSVKYAIHPVAGRMPGHMNVILAEADVKYDDLLEMDDVNPLFKDTDVALVVGACDVVNPSAIETEGTPISGMPILAAYDAKTIIICNLDEKPGYSGVSNPLYENPKTVMLLDDARASVSALISSLKERG